MSTSWSRAARTPVQDYFRRGGPYTKCQAGTDSAGGLVYRKGSWTGPVMRAALGAVRFFAGQLLAAAEREAVRAAISL